MASVRRRLNRVEITLDRNEREVLLHIVDDLADEFGTAARTIPHAYDDPELEKEYARWTRPEVDAVRRADVDAVRAALRGRDDRLRLDEDSALLWLRALNHLRLVAGARMGIDADGWEEEAAPQILESDAYAVLVTLGWLQESIVEALEG